MLAKIIGGCITGGIGLVGIGVGLCVYAEKKSYDAFMAMGKAFDEMEKRNIKRYTRNELKSVVGMTPFDKWTEEHVQKLDKMYEMRRKKCEEVWSKENEKLEKDIEQNPDKYHGLMKLVRYGPSQIYVTGSNLGTDQMGKYYESYKFIEDGDNDEDYEEWTTNEIKRFEKNNNKMLLEMIVDDGDD
tara:strand:- start:1132 stop:1689 length:558 start_codon:yes stop_codon:yes gene_type:complete